MIKELRKISPCRNGKEISRLTHGGSGVTDDGKPMLKRKEEKIMKFERREDAVWQWVAEMNYFPLDMLLKACGDDFYEITPYTEEEEDENREYFPMWSHLWQFSASADERWAESEEGLQALKECGFRVYHSEDFGDFIGIDGFGYSFIREHWTPLYIARGLHWSEED